MSREMSDSDDHRQPTTPYKMAAIPETSESPLLSRRSSYNSSVYIDDADLLGTQDVDAEMQEPTSTLTDLIHTFWSEKRIDLDVLDRKLKQASDRVRQTVHAASAKSRELRSSTDTAAQRARAQQREELKRMRAKVAVRVDKLTKQWAEQKNVRLRDKLTFVIGVMNVVCSSLLFAYRPEWMYLSYTVQCAIVLPIRVFTYWRLHYHYFVFDFCYFANLLNLVYIWFLPENKFLFMACYCSALGPLAFSIATWRNSAVFHSLEKMTSLFIHLYPPLVFCAMRHFTPVALQTARFPAIQQLPYINGWTAFAWNTTFYILWQATYVVFISRRKAKKIASGERINSFSHMSKGKGAMAKVLAKAPVERREWAFIALQFVYTIVCTLPAPLLFYDSYKASAVFCMSLILLSVWNGAGYYVEVFGRRFERELEALRREVQATQQAAAAAAPATPALSRHGSDSGRAADDQDDSLGDDSREEENSKTK